MTLQVFIASSTEGLAVAEAVQKLLKQNLGEQADVQLWTQKFKFGSTYIESLEDVSREADSAVLVFTPDDITKSREAEKLAPRDNVVFELGLFTGSIGRERCILVHEESPELKLPTDLLGVNPATFRRQKALKASLTPLCGRISEQIINIGSRHKLSPHMLATQAAIRDFFGRIKGAWWERIEEEDGSYSISLAQIEWDAPYNSVQLKEGTVFDTEGFPKAHWKSEMARVREDEQNILYLRRCWHPDARDKSWLHGIGDMNFKGPVGASDILDRGDGKFSQFDEANPKRTSVKSVEFRRVSNERVVSIMNNGSKKDRQALLKKTLYRW
jgi:hypothetical protein